MTLEKLALKHGSDKAGHHAYCDIYERYLYPLQLHPITIMELGVGGYHYPDRGGASLKMWYDYFPNAKIIGVDIHEKHNLENDRIRVIKCSQTDPMLAGIQPEVIIDDASHVNDLTIRSFEILFPSLKPGGYYFIEDIESSWCPIDQWARGCQYPDDMNVYTTINLFRKLVNDVNAQYIPNYKATYEIDWIHFYKNIIVVKKL